MISSGKTSSGITITSNLKLR